MSFLRRMKEELLDLDGKRLFPSRFAETISIELSSLEVTAYEAVMEYAGEWYGEHATLALSIYGKRAASSLPAVEATLQRRLTTLKRPAAGSLNQLSEAMAEALRGDGRFSDAFDDPTDLAMAEDVVVAVSSRDRRGEVLAVETVIERVKDAIQNTVSPAKWSEASRLLERHGISPGYGQLLVFTEFADTARWLANFFAARGFTVETLEGAVDHRARHTLQRRFLAGEFQVLVSTDAGGEGINLQSAHVMINWDIPWSLVRLEQRMGRLHRIGQKRDVHVYHLVAPETREGRVQEIILTNLGAAAESLGGRLFDLMDAAVSRVGGFDFARALSPAVRNLRECPPSGLQPTPHAQRRGLCLLQRPALSAGAEPR